MVKVRERIYGVDSIRAFAALSVLLAHILGPVLPDLFRSIHLSLGGTADFSKYIFTGHPAVIVFSWCPVSASITPMLTARYRFCLSGRQGLREL